MVKPVVVKMHYRKNKSWTLDTLYIEPDSPDPEILPLDNHLSGSLLNQFQSVSDLKGISAQSWGRIEALWDIRSPKYSSQ